MLLSDIYLWLAYSKISTSKLNRILETNTPNELWELIGKGCRSDLDERTFYTLKQNHSVEFIERCKQYLSINNIEYITRADPLFPSALTQDEVNPPLVLFYKGNLDVARKPCIAVVGTRRASQYGKYVTERIVKELSKSFTIVSGLATGIDGYAHAATLECNNDTIAVLGSGLFNVTPVSNIPMSERICEQGLLVSEYTPDTHATVYTFPQRNRIISGLSRGVLVIEATEDSGSLITANYALEQGRDVFAVPGDIDKRRSAGTNTLIKQGAIAVTSAKDILEYYGMVDEAEEIRIQQIALNFSEQRVMEFLGDDAKNFDALVEGCGLSVSELNSVITKLTILGLIRQTAKNTYCVIEHK